MKRNCAHSSDLSNIRHNCFFFQLWISNVIIITCHDTGFTQRWIAAVNHVNWIANQKDAIYRSSYRKCPVKKVFLDISQNSQLITCARVSLLKKRLWHRCFHLNFEELFLENTSGGCFSIKNRPAFGLS